MRLLNLFAGALMMAGAWSGQAFAADYPERPIKVVVPFAAYLVAEELGASGVLAVVAAGFYLGHNASRTSYDSRIQERQFWRTADALLETFVFAYIGLQLRFVAGDDDKVRAVQDAVGRGATGGTDLALVAEADLVVAAVAEDTAVKRSLLAAVDDVAKKGAVLATSAATIPVVELAMATDRPQDVVGLHLPDLEGGLAELARARCACSQAGSPGWRALRR